MEELEREDCELNTGGLNLRVIPDFQTQRGVKDPTVGLKVTLTQTSIVGVSICRRQITRTR